MRNKLLLMFLATAMASFAQSEAGRAGIEGILSDVTGKSIASADVFLRETQTGFHVTMTTNLQGAFRAVSLPVGNYSLETTAPGFGSVRAENIALNVGETRTVNLTLQLASVNTQVTVQAAASVVNEADVSNGTSLNERAIAELPVRGRNFSQFLQLTPNSMQEQTRFGIVVNGQRSINANISLDGVDFSDPLQGGQRGGGANQSEYFFPQVAIREFVVVRDGASAEVGRTNAGYVNVVTKSGTNTYHGESFYNNRNGSLTSPDAFGNDSSSNQQSQFGGAVGGPIQRDRLFFFGAAEKNLVTIPYTVKFNPPSGNVAIPQEIASQQGTFFGKNNPLVAFGRVDYLLHENSSVNFQYTYAAQFGLSFNGPIGQTNASATNNSVLNRASQGIKGSWDYVASANLLNELRGQWVYDNRIQRPVSTLPEIDFSDNWAILGGAKGGTEIYNATRTEILDNLSWVHGIHSLKVGIDLNFSPEQQQRESNYSGIYTFRTLSDYLGAVAGDKTRILRYQQAIAANGTQGLYKGMQQDHAVYFTDTMRIHRSFTVTAGLRWEGQINPQPPSPNPKYPDTARIPNDLTMWQPRLGIAWNIAGKGTTVVRLSAGLFDAHTPGYIMQRAFTDNGLNTLVLDSTTDPTILNYLSVPGRIASIPPGIKTPINALYTMDPSYRNPRSGQMALSVERQLDKDTKITVGFVRNATWALQRRVDRNLFAPILLGNGMPVYPTYDSKGNLVYASSWNAATGPVFIDSTGKVLKPAVARPDPTIGAVNYNESVGHSSYNGFSASVQRRLSHRLQFGINFTHAFNRDDDSNERDFNRQSALSTTNLQLDSAWSKNDIRNSGNINLLYNLGRGFTVSTLFLAHSGYPVKAVLGVDLQNDGNTVNDVPVINGVAAYRNTFRQPGFLDWDVRLMKEFKFGDRLRLNFSIEGFNLTRASNKQFNGDGESPFGSPQAAVNPNTGLPFTGNTALIPTGSPGADFFGGARQAQIGMRLIF